MLKKLSILNLSQNQCWPYLHECSNINFCDWILTPNIKGALGRGIVTSTFKIHITLISKCEFQAWGHKIRMSTREGLWNEWFCGKVAENCDSKKVAENCDSKKVAQNCDSKKVAENCDSTGWLGIARPALLQPPSSYKLSMRKSWWWWWWWWWW